MRPVLTLLIAGCALGARAQDTPPPFEERTPFESVAPEAPALQAVRAGAAAEDVHALPVQALGDVTGLRVADVGAGRGRHLEHISQAVGADGRLFVTEITAERCDALREMVASAGLHNVSVVLGEKTDVGLADASIDVLLLSDVYQFVTLLDGRGGQDRHDFLTSLHRALAPDGEVVVTYVTSSELRQEETRRALFDNTLAEFVAYGFESGRRWVLPGPHWPLHVFEFRSPKDGLASTPEYMGREIAQTMHWRGADWLLRAEREREESTQAMLSALGVQSGWTVADYGCGNGYHTLELAKLVGPAGKAYGVDIQPEMLKMLEERAVAAGLGNVVALRGTALDAPLPPGSCDLILIADVYHELSHPVPILSLMRRALKPGGRVAVLEFRAEDKQVPIKPEHKMTRAQVLAEFEANGFALEGEMTELPWQHLLYFRAASGEAGD